MKHNTINLVKFKALSKRLKLPMCWTVGVLESLWTFALNNARNGDLSRFTPIEIAAWMEFPGDETELIDALVATRWLDREGDRLSVHDWDEHKPNWLKALKARGSPNGDTEYELSTQLSCQPSEEPRLQPSSPFLSSPNPPKPNLPKTKPNPSFPNLAVATAKADGGGGTLKSEGEDSEPVVELPPKKPPPPADQQQAWAEAGLVWNRLVKVHRPRTKRERKVMAQLAYLAKHKFGDHVADDAIRAVRDKKPDDTFAYLLGCFKASVRDLYGCDLVEEQKAVQVPDSILNPKVAP